MAIAINSNLVLVSEGHGFSVSLGRYRTQEYTGLFEAIEGLQNEAGILEIDIRHEPGRSHASLKRSDEEGDQATIDYRLLANRVMKSLFTPEVAAVAGIPEHDRLILKHIIQNPSDFEMSSPAFYSDEARKVYKLHLDGVDGVEVYQPVVVAQAIASNNFAFVFSSSNAGRIMTVAQMNGDVMGLPANILGNLPYYVSAIPDMRYGWKKAGVEIDSVPGGRQSCTLQYEYGLWPYLLYLDVEP